MAQAKQFEDAPKSSAGAKVTVACNLPHGIVIRPYEWVPGREPILGGGVKETKIARPLGTSFVINGIARKMGEDLAHRVVAGYAITEGVPKDVWDQWVEDNKSSAMVTNKCVFAYEQADRAIAEAKDNKGRRTGLEPLAQDGDPRTPRPTNRNVKPIAAEEDQAKRRANG